MPKSGTVPFKTIKWLGGNEYRVEDYRDLGFGPVFKVSSEEDVFGFKVKANTPMAREIARLYDQAES